MNATHTQPLQEILLQGITKETLVMISWDECLTGIDNDCGKDLTEILCEILNLSH